MPGMWEMPSFDATDRKIAPTFKLRHSITTTDYSVSVFVDNSSNHARRPGRWVTLRTAQKLPLTGLARKILRRLDWSFTAYRCRGIDIAKSLRYLRSSVLRPFAAGRARGSGACEWPSVV